MGSIKVIPLSTEHVEGAVEMHLMAFKGFFLAYLGRKFLRQLYLGATESNQTVGYVAVDENGCVVGACFGVIDSRKFFKWLLKRRWWGFMLASMGVVLRRPSLIPRLLRGVRHKGHPPPCDIEPLGALQSTAVEPGTQGMGVAIALMRSVCDEYVRRGVHAVHLTTDADNNDRVRQFYEAMGWKFLDTFVTPEGRRMCWYLWKDPAHDWSASASGAKESTSNEA